MKWIQNISLFCLLVAIPLVLQGSDESDSLFVQSKAYLNEAIAIEENNETKIDLAKKAAAGFIQLPHDSLLLEAWFLVAEVASDQKDSVVFVQTLHMLLVKAIDLRDTSAIVRAYNMKGVFYFATGNITKGIETLKIPDQQQYYSEKALEESAYNLGGLVDVSLGYTNNLDSVYYYVNKLQYLASKYNDPSVQIVSRFKLARLFSFSLNHEEALRALREAYPYLEKTDHKGFLHFYYARLINSFIQLNMPDSASHYIQILEKATSYPPNHPRRCRITISKVRAGLSLGTITKLPAEFESCYAQKIVSLEETGKGDIETLNSILARSTYFFQNEKWQNLEEELELLIEHSRKIQSKEFLLRGYELQYESLQQRGLTEQALEAHIQYKECSDEVNQFTFTQSENIVRNQLTLQLAEEENKLLLVENQNQRLLIAQDRTLFFLFFLGTLLLGMLVSYFVHLSMLRAKQSAELSQLVEEKTLQLRETNNALVESNEELTESNTELERFAFVASHDLKTPLYNIIKFSGLLQRKLKSHEDERIHEYLDFIVKDGKRMNHLIEDVLQFSKLKNTADEKEPINLSGLVEDITESISQHLLQKNAFVQMKTDLPTIMADQSKLFLLLKNLIENGIKYNTSSVPKVEVYHSKDENRLSLFVKDNGIGISEEFHEKIFTMFTRLHAQSEFEGSGLGLSICRKIVEELGGQISLESEEGKSTTFRVDFPLRLVVINKKMPAPVEQ